MVFVLFLIYLFVFLVVFNGQFTCSKKIYTNKTLELIYQYINTNKVKN
jgi:hypothetical protein